MFRSKKQVFQWDLRRLMPINWQYCIPLTTIIVLVWHYAALAQNNYANETPWDLRVALDTLWVIVASILVIFMNAGFAMLETGFCRRKNAVNLLSKNLIVFAVSTLSFWAIGFALMFGDGNGFIGSQGFFLLGSDNSPATGDDYQGVYNALNWTGVPLAAKFLFQVAFAGTAATIVSGAVAERVKFIDYLIFSSLLTIILYPIVGHWIWGGGWLAELGFKDFAGSTVVHSIGGWCGLTGALLLGPRLGKYGQEGKIVMPLLPHNLSIATLGCFILWIGWFGFNPGSTMTVNSNIANIAVVTNLAAAAGGLSALITCWCIAGKPDLSLIINAILSGLVAITASCAYVGNFSAVIIGVIAGILVVFAVYFFDSIQIDDPVGALSVHLVNGIWGTLAVGLFASAESTGDTGIGGGLFTTGSFALLGIQILGIVAVAIFSLVLSYILWQVLKSFFGLRVSPEEEFTGLDIGEHGMEAYSGFVTVDSDSFSD